MRLALLLILFSTSLYTFGQDLSVDKIWKQYAFYAKSQDGFNSMSDGNTYTFLDDEGSLMSATISNPNQAPRAIVQASDLRWGDQNLSMEDYAFNKSEDKVLIMTEVAPIYRRSYSANYYLYDLRSKKLEPLSETLSPQTLAEYSPDGTKVSFIHKNDLYIKELKSGKVQQITFDGKRNKIINGTTDWVYEEEFSITKAYGWSPDSKFIAFLKFNEKKVKEFAIDYYGDLYPERYEYKYPKAGEDNSKVTAHWVEVANPKKIHRIELGLYEYIPRIQWSNVENRLLLQTMNRHQDSLLYHSFYFAKPKQIEHKLLYTDTSHTYVDVNENLHFSPDGKGFFLTSEKSGYIQIYQLAYTGELSPITFGKDEVAALFGASHDGEWIYYIKATNFGISKVLFRTNLKTQVEERLSPASGTMDAAFTQGLKYYVGTYSQANVPPVSALYSSSGTLLKTLEDNAELVKNLKRMELSEKKFSQIKVNGVNLNMSIMMPPFPLKPNERRPVYMNVYGGPGHNEVADAWDGNDYMFHQLLCQKGYIVVSVDPRGTQYQGAAFKKSTYLQLGKLETEDIIATAKLLPSIINQVDSARIGIMGWSYGGFMSSSAITKGADVFKMAIAVAPVTNWRYYDNIYTERFMRTPMENAKGYDDNSPINHVQKLKGKYLLIHGMADDNVHFQNSADMVSALVKANKQFDFFAYPNKNHGIYGGNTRNHLFSMIYDYVLKNL